jgi:hypothetical protein
VSVALGLPPPTTTSGGGGDSRWVPLCNAAGDIEAHLLVGRLEQANIETRCVRDRAAPGAWLYGGMNPWAPVTVYVRSHQLDDARLTLAEVAFTGPDAVRSTAIRSRDLSLKWWATAILLGLVLSGLALAQLAGSGGACQVPVLCEPGERAGAR